MLPECTSKIEDSAFCGCTQLAEITIPDGVSVIDSKAFDGCDKSILTIIGDKQDVRVPENVKIISTSAFSYSRILNDITIPDTVTQIDDSA